MMADHQHLESQCLSRFVNDLDKPGNQVRPKPAVLLVEHEKTSMPCLVESRQGKHSQSNADDVGNGTTLPPVDILFIAVSFNAEFHRRGAAFEIRRGLELQRLLKYFLKGDR